MDTTHGLQIGNLLLTDSNIIVQVADIKEFRAMAKPLGKDKCHYNYHRRELHGLGLTQERLLWLGFVPWLEGEQRVLHLMGDISEDHSIEIDFEVWQSIDQFTLCLRVKCEDVVTLTFIPRIRFVHEIQNLYLLLTGEQLEINL